MSIQQKQEYLRDTIINKGISTEEFFQYWQTLELELDQITLDKLQQVVTTFLKIRQPHQKAQMEHSHQKSQELQEEQQQFSDFQEAESRQSKQEVMNINWDFLNIKKHHNHEHLLETSQDSSPQKMFPIELTTQKQPVDQIIQLTQIVKPKIQTKPLSKQIVKTIQKKQKYKKEPINSNLIEQANQAPIISKKQLQSKINPKQQKSLTVKQVLESSKLQTLKCLKLQENILSHHVNVEIFITNVQEVEDKPSNIINKLIKNTSLVFTIKTVARNKNRSVGVSWEVKRKHQDFQWLRGMLVKFYPGLVVPPLPTQTKSKEKLFGYQKKLQHFLLDCYRCPQLKNSKYYQIFLSYSNSTDFDTYVKNSINASKPKSLNHILNMTGVVKTLYSSNIEQYGTGLHNYLAKTANHLKQVNHILGEINESYDNISQLYKDLSNVFLEMSDESHSFSDQKCYERLANTYKEIAGLTNQHSNFCQRQKEFVDAFMMSHFSYQKMRLENMQGLITKRTTFASQLSKCPKQQQSKGMFGKLTSIFGDKTEYVDTPSSNYETLNNQVGYYNNQLLQQSIRCIEVMIESHVNHFSGYGHSRIDNVDNMQKIWSNILVELSRLNLSK